MLRCPECGQTHKAWLEGKGSDDYMLLSFKRRAVLDDHDRPVDLEQLIENGAIIRCLYCRHEAPVKEWREARLKPASLWDEEEDIGVISDSLIFAEEDVENLDDLDQIQVAEEDPWGGDDDGSDD